ncbi:MAG: alpha/beta hydrolase [Comamonadaceae bacterium]|nr:MAG: alpha/beta hydrolase [Comamonadaceae bacterium]
MRTLLRTSRVLTSHGRIAVEEAGRGDTTLLFIHGNSSCREMFRHQMNGPLAQSCRLIAFDLPGHGESDDAVDPNRTYTRPGYADCAIELLQLLGVADPVVFGWSLGGHIAIEMMARCPELRGVMIIGAPPVGPGEAASGFRSNGHGALGRQRRLSESEVAAFAHYMTGGRVEPFLLDAIARTDGRAREILFNARDSGAGINQRRAVEECAAPLAVVNGEEDAFIQVDFFDRITYANLWEGQCHRLSGQGHAAFWSGPGLFNPLLERFVRDVGPR